MTASEPPCRKPGAPGPSCTGLEPRPGAPDEVGPDGYEQHPLLNRTVRDVASRGEGVLVAVTHELHSHGTVRIAHIRPESGIEWTTAAENVQATR